MCCVKLVQFTVANDTAELWLNPCAVTAFVEDNEATDTTFWTPNGQSGNLEEAPVAVRSALEVNRAPYLAFTRASDSKTFYVHPTAVFLATEVAANSDTTISFNGGSVAVSENIATVVAAITA